MVHFVMATAVTIAALSCTSDSSNAYSNNSDSASGNNNAMNTGTNASADQHSMMTDSSANTNSDSTQMDTVFMRKAAEINMEEIKLGKLAREKATLSHVKEMGKMMVMEHEQALAGLTAMAKTKMVNLPTTEREKTADAYKTLNSKTGKDFDKAYSDMMVSRHKEAIELFENADRQTKDAAIKAMTTKMIPKLKTHLEHAEMCQKESIKM